MKLHIAVLPGDGIGPEVVEQALNVTKAVCEKFGHSLEYQTAPVGACAIEETGLPYPDSTPVSYTHLTLPTILRV